MMEPDEIVAHLTETETRSKSNTKRLDRLEQTVDAIHELAKNVAVLAESQNSVKKDVEEIKNDVQALKAIPGKRWEQVIDKLIFGGLAAALGAVLGVVVSRLF